MSAEKFHLDTSCTYSSDNADVEVLQSSTRKRKPNFSAQEISIITEMYEENQQILKSKFSNIKTNKLKQSVWENIAIAVNATGHAKRTVTEVKEKWTNLQRTLKQEFAKFRKAQKKTGGGPQPSMPSAATEKIIDMFQNTPAFKGLEGFETGEMETIDVADIRFDTDFEDDQPMLAMAAPVEAATATALETAVEPQERATDQERPQVKAQALKCKITSSDLVKSQYEALQMKKENLLLKKEKLQLEIELLKWQLAQN